MQSYTQAELEHLIERYGRAGPRYTSYPTALHFEPGFDRARVTGRLGHPERPAALYVHVPFCERRCLFCGCHTLIRRDRSIGARYVDGLIAELKLLRTGRGGALLVHEVHFGGGTPTWLAPEDMKRLVDAIHEVCVVREGGEWAIEVDPETVDRDALTTLVDQGFTRFSFGVQDLDEHVAKAIGRKMRTLHLGVLTEHLRGLGITEINFDLIYGLPYQDLTSIRWTMDEVATLRPSRIALYGYAHVPWIKRHQRGLEKHNLPQPLERLNLLLSARDQLEKGGFVAVGMDHFATADDPLAQAAAEGRMRRNFMGYTSGKVDDIIAVGSSAISSFSDAFAQNAKDLQHWRGDIDAGRLPWAMGLVRNEDDRVRAVLIERLMCDLKLDKATWAARYGADWDAIWAQAVPSLKTLADDALITLNPEGLQVTEMGTIFLRNIAMAFDGRLKPAATDDGPRHAQTV